MLKFVLYAVLLIEVVDHASAKIPSYLKLCKRHTPDLQKCLLENVDILRPKFKQGVPELLIPSFDPLVISEATLNSGSSFKAVFRDIRLYQVDNFEVEYFKVDLDNYHIDITIKFPRIRIQSNYNLSGRLLVLNLDGKGPADGNYTNVEAMLSLKGKPFQKNNKEYVKWEKEVIDIKIGKAYLFFEKIFGDNAQLNDQTNKVINENSDGIIEELSPVIKQAVTDIVFSVVNRVFARYAISELFPNS